jgi:hypothetical protein
VRPPRVGARRYAVAGEGHTGAVVWWPLADGVSWRSAASSSETRLLRMVWPLRRIRRARASRLTVRPSPGVAGGGPTPRRASSRSRRAHRPTGNRRRPGSYRSRVQVLAIHPTRSHHRDPPTPATPLRARTHGCAAGQRHLASQPPRRSVGPYQAAARRQRRADPPTRNRTRRNPPPKRHLPPKPNPAAQSTGSTESMTPRKPIDVVYPNEALRSR